MTALRWLGHGSWGIATHVGTAATDRGLTLAVAAGGHLRHGFAVVPAGRPSAAQIDSERADRWRRVVLALAEPVPAGAWLRLWTRVEPDGSVPDPPEPATDLADDAPVPSPAGAWRAAAVGALDARVLCLEPGELWVAIEFGGPGSTSPVVSDLRVETGDDGPVTLLPGAYRSAGADPGSSDAAFDDGDASLGRFLGLLGAQLEHTSSLLAELPRALSPSVAPDRADAGWLERLASWVGLDPGHLPSEEGQRRDAVANAAARHARRGTPDGLAAQVLLETGIEVEIYEPLLTAAVWRLDGDPATSALGVTTGLLALDPGPPTLDSTAHLDASMLIDRASAGRPVHAHLAHRICVHVPDASAAQLAAVDAVVQRERPAHVLARTSTSSALTAADALVGGSTIPGPGPTGLAHDQAHSTHLDGPGVRLGTAPLPAPEGEAS